MILIICFCSMQHYLIVQETFLHEITPFLYKMAHGGLLVTVSRVLTLQNSAHGGTYGDCITGCKHHILNIGRMHTEMVLL